MVWVCSPGGNETHADSSKLSPMNEAQLSHTFEEFELPSRAPASRADSQTRAVHAANVGLRSVRYGQGAGTETAERHSPPPRHNDVAVHTIVRLAGLPVTQCRPWTAEALGARHALRPAYLHRGAENGGAIPRGEFLACDPCRPDNPRASVPGSVVHPHPYRAGASERGYERRPFSGSRKWASVGQGRHCVGSRRCAHRTMSRTSHVLRFQSILRELGCWEFIPQSPARRFSQRRPWMLKSTRSSAVISLNPAARTSRMKSGVTPWMRNARGSPPRGRCSQALSTP